jgi:hypothetical protein
VHVYQFFRGTFASVSRKAETVKILNCIQEAPGSNLAQATSKIPKAVKILNHIQEVPGSNLSQDTVNLDQDFTLFYSVPQNKPSFLDALISPIIKRTGIVMAKGKDQISASPIVF